MASPCTTLCTSCSFRLLCYKFVAFSLASIMLYQLSIADLQCNYIVHGPRCVSTVNEYGELRPIEQRGSALVDHIIAEK